MWVGTLFNSCVRLFGLQPHLFGQIGQTISPLRVICFVVILKYFRSVVQYMYGEEEAKLVKTKLIELYRVMTNTFFLHAEKI